MLKDIYSMPNVSCSLLVGPEGDFTNEEYSFANESGFSSVSLGDNILRVETAAIAAFSYLQIINNIEKINSKYFFICFRNLIFNSLQDRLEAVDEANNDRIFEYNMTDDDFALQLF